MLNYQSPFGRAGGAAGAGVLGGLGRMLEPLDYARQALWNIPGKLGEGDVLGALPGLLGAGLGAGLAATGVGAPLAVLGGSLLGGAAQGVGKAVDEDRFQAPDGNELIKALGGDPDSVPGMVGGMALNALGDPLSYAGGLGGRAAGRNVGKGLEDIGLTRGPRYAGGAEKLAAGVEQGGRFGQYSQELLDSPYASQILGEIPPGSTPLGNGVEAIAFKTPDGGVVRLSGGPEQFSVRSPDRGGSLLGRGSFGESSVAGAERAPNTMPPPPRVNIPEVLQASRDIPFGPYRVEHTPFIDVPHGQVTGQTGAAGRLSNPEQNAAVNALSQAVEERGFRDVDIHGGNFGKTKAGNYVVHDPGSVDVPLGVPQPKESINQRQGNAVQNWLLDMLGSDKTIQQGISKGAAEAGGMQGIALPERAVGSIFDSAHGTESSLRRPVRNDMEIFNELANARGARGDVWEQALQARGAKAPLAVQEPLLGEVRAREQKVRQLKDLLGLPHDHPFPIGTPMAPFAEQARAANAGVTPGVNFLMDAALNQRVPW